MAKIFYAWSIMRDKNMPENVVRSTTIPEELGRIGYVLTDKTGTLTKNEMIMKKFHVTSEGYSPESFPEVRDLVARSTLKKGGSGDVMVAGSNKVVGPSGAAGESRLERARARKAALVAEAVKAVALCHNVTPIDDDDDEPGPGGRTYQVSKQH